MKNPNFLPEISYFMTYHSKIHIKVSKFNNKLSRPNFRPFWTPVNFLKLMKPDLYNFFESSFWTPWWCSFLVYKPFFWRNSFVNKWYLVGVVPYRRRIITFVFGKHNDIYFGNLEGHGSPTSTISVCEVT